MNNKANTYLSIMYNIIDNTISKLIENEISKYESDINYDYVDELINLLDTVDNYMGKIKDLIWEIQPGYHTRLYLHRMEQFIILLQFLQFGKPYIFVVISSSQEFDYIIFTLQINSSVGIYWRYEQLYIRKIVMRNIYLMVIILSLFDIRLNNKTVIYVYYSGILFNQQLHHFSSIFYT